MKTLELLIENLRKKNSNMNYSLEKSKLKAEFLTMCKKFLHTPSETLVFSFSTPRDLSTFLDIVDEDDIKSVYNVSQEDDKIFRVELKDIDILE